MIEVLILGITITFVVFLTWKFMLDNETDLITARSVIMMLMVFVQNVDVLNCRSEKKSVFKKTLLDNKMVLLTVFGSIILQVIVSELDFTAQFLKVTPLAPITIAKIFFLSLIIIAVFEIYKIFLLLFKKD